ncbi:MAG: T9SS sorting signal type C domain-containing protein [Flavobacterium sp.]|uniref:Ig-like domain-containing protein n=1 Tax=Flavobacterium sp. TaxID=239 RepID=UPI0026352BEC|nr:LamG-like jellyroll fold domain-containing protein [Flavobacterium sp.]MDD5148851.1 T9SS sorting signal type C domain-containing protein [Flavobacterium sp.]
MRKIILKLMLLFICLLLTINTKAQTIRYVKPIATGTGDGSSWANATNDLQAMIFISGAGDEVWVASGTYYPTQYPIFNSNDPSTNSSYPTDERDKTFSIKDNMKLYGGFVGTETLLSQRPAYTNDASASILSGDIDKDGALNWGNCWHVVFSQYTSPATIFDGFTVTGGHAVGTRRMAVQGYYVYQNSGGGMNCTRNGNATLNNIIFKGNQASLGGGINNFSTSSPTITNCKFIDNLAVTGGGINSQQNCNPSVSNCIFSTNYCTSSGGGLNYYLSNPTVTNSVFTGNRANDAGGAIYGTNGTLNLLNCTFSANETLGNGGAIHSSYNTNISNCIIWGNSANGVLNSNAGGYYNSNINATSSVNYSIVQGSSVYAGIGNSNADPLFVNSTLPAGSDAIFGTSDDGLALQFTSLGVDSSNPTTSSPATDITGFTRVGVFDSGAYENRCNPPAPTVSATPLFCGAVLENMAVGSNIKWYDALTGGNLLNSTALLVNGTTYYATQTPIIGSCESHPRTAMTANFILTSCIYTAIPDTNFEQELITKGYDTVIDGKVLTANISAITTLNVSNKNIASLTGIQDFVSLTSLNCSFNQLTSLNIAGLIHLSVLDCNSNALTSLNISTLVNLAFLNCGYNQLTSLNISGLNALQAVSCDYNQITSLNGSGLLSLGYITCDHNQLTSINISGLSNFINLIADHNQLTSVDLSGGTNPHLLYLHNNLLTDLNLSGKTNLTVLNCLNNPNITCIRVDNVTTATNNLSWQKDATASYSSTSCTSSPIAASLQHFCSAVTIADLTASGTNLKWYADAASTTVLSSSTPLSSANYYVSQTINDDESPRTVVTVEANTTPIPGNSLNFDGIDDSVSISNQPVSNLTNFTLEAWVYASGNSSRQTIYAEGNTSDDNPMFSIIRLPNTTGFEIILRNSASVGLIVSSTTGFMPLNTWTHIAFVRTSETTASLYINGLNTDNFTFANPGSIAVNVTNIGVRQRVGFDDWFNGNLDEVRIWNRTLPIAEIQNNKDNELVSGQTGLVAYYKFNQGINNANNTTINTLTDSSGNTNTGTLNGFALTGSTSNWVAMSPIATTTAPQTLCNGTVADLTATATGTINWYDVATGGSPLVGTTTLTTGTYYYTQTISGCESARIAVLVTANLSPTPTASAQVFGNGATVANLTASGTGTINWYDVETGGSPLVATTTLITRTYYVSQTVGTCESSRTAVSVTVGVPAPTAVSPQVFTGTATLADLTATGTAIQWYATASGGLALANTTSLTDGATYYASQTLNSCESLNRLAVTVTKISEPAQTVCNSSTVADLVSTASAGATINWYSAPSGGVALTGGTALSAGIYYAEQTIAENTSALGSGFLNPTGVSVQADGKIVVADYGNNAIKRMNADGTAIVTLGSGFLNPTGVAVQTDGKILVADTNNGAIKLMNADGTGIVTLGSGFSNPTGIAIQADGKILVSDIGNGTLKRMNADGTGIVTLGSGFSVPYGVAVQADGKILLTNFSSHTVKQMNADGTDLVTLGSGFNLPYGVAVQSDGKILVVNTGNNSLKRMNADGTGIIPLGSGLWNPYGITVQSDGTILVADGNNHTIKKITVASVSNRVAVNIIVNTPPIAPTANAQTFCSGATVADLVATGTALQWYDVASGGSALLLTDVLATGTYYVSQTITGCESARTSVSVTLGNTTTWNGLWDNGAPTSYSKVIIASDFTAIADLSACSLDITGTAVVSVPTGFNFNISGAVTVAPTASLTFENDANLVQIDNVANAGNITVKRNSSPLIRQDYTLWSSPVAGQQLLAFSPATLINRFYIYNPTTNLYNTIAPTFDFNIGTGYLIRMPNTHPTIPTIWNGVFSGVPNNGTINYTMTDGGVGFRFNLTGNPYPSPINMARFVTDNTNITGTLYFWRKTNNPLSPSYCSWTAGTFTTNGEAQVVDPNGIIQTGQGFFVEANGTGTALTFKNTQRIGNTVGQFFKTKAVERNRIWLNATNTSGAFSQMAVGYITDATQGVDAFDGKYYNDGAIALSSIIDNNDYAIQGRALPFDANDVVLMSFSAKTAGDYSIAIDHVDGLFSGSQSIVLKDNLTGAETDLKAGAYTFTAAAGTDKTRFTLKYQKTLGINNPTFDENSVTVFKNKGVISIKSVGTTIANVKVFDILGRLIFEKSKVNASETSIDGSKFANQVLMVKITSEANKVVNKKVIN